MNTYALFLKKKPDKLGYSTSKFCNLSQVSVHQRRVLETWRYTKTADYGFDPNIQGKFHFPDNS